ncbi:MAG TPA: N-acetylmuramoyl-L-alanine amidase, partial [Terriglobales bacterium]|nr:N-acetylmuramoyl-L-alanine amidase [Terriglobales bacterium]
MRDTLKRGPAESHTRRDYQRVIAAYRRVYYLDPGSAKAPSSVLAVADLLAQMGRQFEDGKVLRAAAGQYRFLIKEYPGNPYAGDALLGMAGIYQHDLHQPAQARPILQQFLKEHPHSKRTGEARQALAEIQPPRRPAAPEMRRPAVEQRAPAPIPADDRTAGLARITGVRYWSAAADSRVAIDLDSDITFHSERLRNPDRVVFDLHWTRLSPSLASKTLTPKDGLLKRIRVSEYKPGDARIILDVRSVANYSAFLLPNPDRLIIDVHGRLAPTTAKKRATGAGAQAATESDTEEAAEPDVAGRTARKTAAIPAGLKQTLTGPKIISDEDEDSSAAQGTARDALPPSVKRPSRVVIRDNSEEAEAREARPTSSGDRSLIRALGLKIGRIVIDPGHGGHDTGTIGPHGLEEKDLVLDVALRLGRLLEQRLGADVVYTRRDDTFIPLETRTAIANQAQADLFVSVHANSSHDPDARGVETYYLNFTTSSDALEVAARENAVSDQSIHQLQ